MQDKSGILNRDIIFERVNVLHKNICDLSETLKIQMNSNDEDQIKKTADEFRLKFIEIYYLIRYENGIDENLIINIEKWNRIPLYKIEDKTTTYEEGLILFNQLSANLVSIGGILCKMI